MLENLDSKNCKALFRRAHSYRSQQKYEEAVRDLQLLMKEGPTDAIKKDLNECMAKFMEQRKKAAEAPKV